MQLLAFIYYFADGHQHQVMTCSDNSFIDRWMKHMEGAAKIIEFRGLEQLTRREGLDLFTNLRAQIVSLLLM
jgi:hypothetical protein